MSVRALCLGVVDRLRAVLPDAEGRRVGYHPDGAPPATSGIVYVAVSFGGFRSLGNLDRDDHRAYGVVVTLTWKAGRIPRDRQGQQESQEGPDHLDDLADQLPGWLLPPELLLPLVNARITGAGASTDGFFKGFDSFDCGESKDGPNSGERQITLRFHGAERIRAMGTVA